MSWLFASGDQNTGASASASVPPMSIQGLFPFKIGWFDLLAVQRTLRSLLQHQFVGINSLVFCLLYSPYVTTGKTIALTIQIFVGRVTSLFFNTLSMFIIAFLPRSNCLLTLQLQSPFTVILEPKKRKSVTTSTFSPLFAMR